MIETMIKEESKKAGLKEQMEGENLCYYKSLTQIMFDRMKQYFLFKADNDG